MSCPKGCAVSRGGEAPPRGGPRQTLNAVVHFLFLSYLEFSPGVVPLAPGVLILVILLAELGANASLSLRQLFPSGKLERSEFSKPPPAGDPERFRPCFIRPSFLKTSPRPAPLGSRPQAGRAGAEPWTFLGTGHPYSQFTIRLLFDFASDYDLDPTRLTSSRSEDKLDNT